MWKGILAWCGRKIAFIAAAFAVILAFYYVDGLHVWITRMNEPVVTYLLSSSSWWFAIGAKPFIHFGLLVLEGVAATFLASFIVRRVAWGLFNGRSPAMTTPAAGPAPAPNAGSRIGHLHFMHWPNVRRFNETFFPSAGLVAPFALSGLYLGIFWGNVTIGSLGSGGFNSLSDWRARIIAIYVIIMGGAAVFRPAYQVGRMMLYIVLSMMPVIVVLVAIREHGISFTAYQWSWIEDTFWYIFILDVLIFNFFMAEINYYAGAVHRDEDRVR